MRIESKNELHQLLRLLIVISFSLQLIIYLKPYFDSITDTSILTLLQYDGFRSKISLNLPILIYFPLFTGLIMSVGLFFLKNWGRYLFVILWLYGLVSSLLFGIRVSLPSDGFIGTILTTIDGVIFAIIFITPLSAQFDK